ncbi:MAG TPA: hypothetical protein VK993_01460 [Chthoniobacterales bacterium]|nr:hypothetical protein [Chthoniobacterales bacterium]
MKPLLLAFSVVGALSFAGCANEGPTPEELQDQVRRGATGQGTVMPEIDRTGDPYVRPREGPPPARDR